MNDGEVPKYQSQKAIEGGKSGNLALTWDGDEESNPNMETGAGGGGGAMGKYIFMEGNLFVSLSSSYHSG